METGAAHVTRGVALSTTRLTVLLLRQPAVIGKHAGRGVGEPRGHFSCQDGLSNGLRPRPHFLISRHGKRRGFPCAMTDLTSLLQDRLHIRSERDRTDRKSTRLNSSHL